MPPRTQARPRALTEADTQTAPSGALRCLRSVEAWSIRVRPQKVGCARYAFVSGLAGSNHQTLLQTRTRVAVHAGALKHSWALQP